MNYVQQLVADGVTQVDDRAVAEQLISTHLSKPTTKKFGDQIGRRARDHLETGRYLGLLYRVRDGRKLWHFPTVQGKALTLYSFEEECPRDYREEAILIDRVCRVKLTNTSYMQTPRGYESFRSRICLNILTALKKARGELSLSQIAYILGEPRLDPYTHPNKLAELVRLVQSNEFIDGYAPNDDQRKSIHRDTNPFLDWCAQLDLVRRSEDESVRLTGRGRALVDKYATMVPIWYSDLGSYAPIAAAGTLLINYFRLTEDENAIDELVRLKARFGLFETKMKDVLKGGLGKFYNRLVRGATIADFTFEYDVPPGQFLQVKAVIRDLLSKLGFASTKAQGVIRFLETSSAKSLLPEYRGEAHRLAERIAERGLPRVKVRAASIYSQFRSDFEASTYMWFKTMERKDFRIQKYQAQLAHFFAGDKRWERFAKNNPDLLLSNDFFGLIECKSTGEWGDKLRLNKQVLEEIMIYNSFCKALKSLGLRSRFLILFSYEGRIPTDEADRIDQLLRRDFPSVVLITRKALQRTLVDVSFKNLLKHMVKAGKFKEHVIDA